MKDKIHARGFGAVLKIIFILFHIDVKKAVRTLSESGRPLSRPCYGTSVIDTTLTFAVAGRVTVLTVLVFVSAKL